MTFHDQANGRRIFYWRSLIAGVLLGLLTYASPSAQAQEIRWDGHFAPCPRHDELLKHDAMTIGVKISTSSGAVRKAFIRAMDFWSSVVDMTWYEDDGSFCAINVVDGTPAILSSAAVQHSLLPGNRISSSARGVTVVARSQMPEASDFEGWIAFNAHLKLPEQEMYLNAVHEIGHLLGLEHSQDPASVMYFVDVPEAQLLDRDDLAQLSMHHKLREPTQEGSVRVTP